MKPWQHKKKKYTPKELKMIDEEIKHLTQKEANNLLKLGRERIIKQRDQILDAYNNKEITKEEMEKIFKEDKLLIDTTELDQVIKEHE